MRRRGWQDQIIEKMPSGVDAAQVAELLKLTPTERLERMRQFLEEMERLRPRDGHSVPTRR
jgi:hypothetical protein